MTPDEIKELLTTSGYNAIDFPMMRVTALTYMQSFSLAMPANERWIDAGKLSTGLSLWVLAYHDTLELIINSIVNPDSACPCSRCVEIEPEPKPIFPRIDLHKYEKCHCGSDCDYFGAYSDEPCWGEVSPLGLSGDDDFGHFCKGHEPRYYGEKYKAKPD